MAINIEDPIQKRPGNGKMLVGLLLLILGVGFLLEQIMPNFIPDWLVSWPTGLIILGLYMGARHNFNNAAWFILVIIGAVNILEEIFRSVHIHDMLWPLGVIAVGIWFILKRNQSWDQRKWNRKWDNKWNTNYTTGDPFKSVITPVTPEPATGAEGSTETPPPASGSTNIPPTGAFGGGGIKGDDYLDAVSVFGGVKKIILSKNFRGGEIVNIFGGAELDFTQADIIGHVVIDITQIFGGTKIIVPGNWQVVSDLAAVFASVDDKRIRSNNTGDINKVLVLKGVSIFAGVEIRSY